MRLRTVLTLAMVTCLAGACFGTVDHSTGLKDVSRDEAANVSGGWCPILINVGSLCNVGGPLGIKFWEGCPSTPTYQSQCGSGGMYTIGYAPCTTTCGYSCGCTNPPVSCGPGS